VQGVRSVDAPVRFDFFNRQEAPRAPEVGEHTAEILADIGYTQELAVLQDAAQKEQA